MIFWSFDWREIICMYYIYIIKYIVYMYICMYNIRYIKICYICIVNYMTCVWSRIDMALSKTERCVALRRSTWLQTSYWRPWRIPRRRPGRHLGPSKSIQNNDFSIQNFKNRNPASVTFVWFCVQMFAALSTCPFESKCLETCERKPPSHQGHLQLDRTKTCA
jgi:hypothetical protein